MRLEQREMLLDALEDLDHQVLGDHVQIAEMSEAAAPGLGHRVRAVHHQVDNRRILNPALWKGGVPAVPMDDCDPPVGGHPDAEAAFSQIVGVKDRPQKLWRGCCGESGAPPREWIEDLVVVE